MYYNENGAANTASAVSAFPGEHEWIVASPRVTNDGSCKTTKPPGPGSALVTGMIMEPKTWM
jgi:hypothetical protein